MLTGFQVSTGAYATEDYSLLCESCFDTSDEFCRPVSNYELDEHDVAMAEGYFYDDPDHVEYCSCTPGIQCDGCYGDLREAYTDPQCEALQRGDNDEESDIALD